MGSTELPFARVSRPLTPGPSPRKSPRKAGRGGQREIPFARAPCFGTPLGAWKNENLPRSRGAKRG
jgi:hypothetical protein